MMQVASCNRHFNYLLVFFFLKTQDHELEQALFVMADGVIMMVTYGTNNRMADDPRCDSKKTQMRKLTIFNRNYVDDPADLRDVLEHLFQVDIID